MKKLVPLALIACFVATISITVFAQPGGGRGQGGPRGFGGGGLDSLLRNENIQKHLGLSDDQTKKIQGIAEESQRSFRERRQAGPQQDGPPSRERMTAMRIDMERQREVTDTKIKQVLTAEQQENLKTLRFQLADGLDARELNVDLLEALKLTADQTAKMKALETESQAEVQKLMSQINWGNQEEREDRGPEIFGKAEELRNQYSGKIKALLTPEQIQLAEKLAVDGRAVKEKIGPLNQGGRGPGGQSQPRVLRPFPQER